MTMRLLDRSLITGALCVLAACLTPAGAQQRARHPARHPAGAAAGVVSAAAPVLLAKTAAVTIPWFDDMESGTAGWTATGFWHLPFKPQTLSILSPTINPDMVTLPDNGQLPAPNSGNYCWWYGENSTGTFIGSDFDRTQTGKTGGTSTASNSGNLTTPPISLVGQTSAVLSFWTWWEIEGVESNAYDVMSVLASTDGGLTWNPLGRGELNPLNDPAGESWKPYTSNGLGQKGAWTEQFFDLTPYAGKVVNIQFNFDTRDALYNGFRGWFIDDIGVTPGSTSAPIITAVTPSVVNPTFTPVASILGANFVSGATIKVDTTTVPGGVLNSSLAQFDPTGLSPGSHGVTITNPNGQFFTKIRSFSVSTATPPTFISVVPDSAPAGIGVPLTITGSHFQPGLVVNIGGVAVPGPKLVDSTTVQVVSPTTLPVGAYNVIVANPDSLSDIGLLAFRVTPFVYATGDSLIGRSQTLQITPVSPLYTSGRIYFRMGGKTAYDSLALTGSLGQFSVDLPASVITMRGVEYYLTLFTVQAAQLTYPAVNPALAPAVLPIRAEKLVPPSVATVAVSQYRMVSSPVLLENPFVLAQLSDDFGPYNPAQWRVFHWVRNGYRELVPFAGLTMEPGDAFWIITATGMPFTLRRAISVPSNQPYTVPVDTGWNQIGDPFDFNVAWAQVGGSSSLTLPYYYDGKQYRTTNVLTPFAGYFVYNGVGEQTTLQFFPVETSLTASLAREDGAAGPGEYLLRLSAAMPGTDYCDTYNYIGFRTGATPGRDRLDAPKPPPIGDGVQLNILEGGIPYLENYKPAGGTGASWVIDLIAAGAKGRVLLALSASGTLPSGYGVHLLDLTNANAVPGVPGTIEVNLDAPNAPRYFKVIIGTDAYAASESQGIPLEPVAYALAQNYPNPFNPSTTIRYALAKKGEVTLEVFNTLGQRVRTLVSGEQTTGEHVVLWDGTSDAGSHVASGLYFYRLRAGEFTAVRKLVMIR